MPRAVLPACLAAGFDGLHAPVRQWQALMAAIDETVTRLEALEAASGERR